MNTSLESMFVCVGLFMYVCVFTYVCVCVYVFMYPVMCRQVCGVCVCVYIVSVCVSAYVFVRMCVCASVLRICVPKYMRGCEFPLLNGYNARTQDASGTTILVHDQNMADDGLDCSCPLVAVDYGLVLTEICVDVSQAAAMKQMAAVLLRQYVDVHWSEDALKYSPPETPAHVSHPVDKFTG